MPDHIIVLVTCPATESHALAQSVVEQQLAACVNIIPGVTSVYTWEGKTCKEEEQLLVIKTDRSRWESLRDRVKQLHSYSVPEIIAIPIEDGYKPYIDWMNSALGLGQ